MEPVIHPYNPYSTIPYADDSPFTGEPECPCHDEANVAERADLVNKPLHYNYGKTEVIDYIMQVCALYPGHQAALVANVIKYVSRAPMKGDKEKDLKKAQWYLNKLVESI